MDGERVVILGSSGERHVVFLMMLASLSFDLSLKSYKNK